MNLSKGLPTSHLPIKPAHQGQIRTASFAVALLGVLTIALGFFMTGPRLVEYVTEYLSEDRQLSEATIASLHAMHLKIIVLGAVITLAALLPRYVVPMASPLVSRIEVALSIKIVLYGEKLLSAVGSLMRRLFDFVSTEKCMWSYVALVLLMLSIPAIFLAPIGGFHVEGIDLQPAKNLVRHGIYGTLTTRGFDDLTHRSSAGPGIIVPQALLFKLFGINVYLSRALQVAFVLGNILLFHRTACKLYGPKVARLAVYIFVPWLIFLSRGELPAGGEGYNPGLFYFLAGALLWFKGIETNKNVYLALCGVLWGLAFQTKWLFLFAVFGLVLSCGLLRLAKHGLGSKYWVVPITTVGMVTFAWVVFRVANLGLRQEVIHLKLFLAEHMHRAVGFTTAELSRPWEILRPLATLTLTDFNRVDLWGDLQLFLIIPAVMYVLILLLRKGMSDHRSLLLLSFSAVWFAWWFFFNYDLALAHLLVFSLLSQLFIAKFLVTLWEYSLPYKTTFWGSIRHSENQGATMSYLLRVAIVCIVMGKVILPLSEKAGSLYSHSVVLTRPYNEMTAFIRSNAEKEAVFSGWDWSMPWYVDLDNERDHIVKDRATYPMEQREAVTEYFIVSPEWPLVKVTDEWPSVAPDSEQRNNELRKRFLEEHCTLVKAFGGPRHRWLLYRVNNKALGQLPIKNISEVSRLSQVLVF